MTLIPFLLILLTESCAILGQIFFKHAMSGRDGIKKGRLAVGIAAMAVNFFLWNGLLSRFDLSYLYPFDGLNRVMLVIAASIFLKEKMTLNLWVGVGLISAGVLLVSRS
jgi:uncharacterized membrane protein